MIAFARVLVIAVCLSVPAAEAYSADDAVVSSSEIARKLRPRKTRGIDVEERARCSDHGSISLQIPFENNLATLSPAASAQLDELGGALRTTELSSMRFSIVGHTSATGSVAYNLALSRSRAEAVRSYLAEHFGIDAMRLDASGVGFTRPLTELPPDSAEQRRVEILSRPAECPGGNQ